MVTSVMERGYACLRWILPVFVVYTSMSGTQELNANWCVSKDGRIFHQHPRDCTSYVICRQGEPPVVMRCSYGFRFDEISQKCNYKEHVKCHPEGLETGDPRLDGHTWNRTTSSGNPRAIPVYLRHKALFKEIEAGDKKATPVKDLSFEDKVSLIRGEMAYIMPHIRVHAHIFYSNLSAMAKEHKGHRRPFRHVQSFLGNQPNAHRMSYTAYEQIEFLKDLKKRYALTKTEMHYVIRRLGRLTDIIRPNRKKVSADMDPEDVMLDMEACPFSEAPENDCDKYALYRSLDGSCNNLKHPLWGRAIMPLAREVESDYEDGISEPRSRGVSGRGLPGARRVSWYVMPDVDRPSQTLTALHMTFGQMLDHDVGRTAMTMIKDRDSGKLINVECGKTGCETTGPENSACLPIPIPENDSAFYGHKKCLMFVRSQEVLKEDCTLGPRQQLNQLTSYLDSSFVYGSSKTEANKLRDLSDPSRGKLKMTPNENPSYKGLLPQRDHPDCRDITPKRRCFLAGDTRVNEQVALVSLHTVFHRYHNELEERLFMLNPQWDGERLYQEARRIGGAIWQHIVYKEYLPSTLGVSQMRKYGIELLRHGFYNAYDDSVNVDTGNAFQTAAFRFGHSQISSDFLLANRQYHSTGTLQFSQVFNRPNEIYHHYPGDLSGVDSILLGQLSQAAAEVDPFFSQQVTTRLFSENPPKEPGTDLPALNIQRGRDHGLPGYVKYRDWCGLSVPNSFFELVDIPEASRANLKRTYENVTDIDLFAGGMLERQLQGSLVGPTFACIIGREFRRKRVADSFWYERYDPVTGFTEESRSFHYKMPFLNYTAQLAEIRKMTLSRIICDSLDKVEKIQKYALLQPFSIAMRKYQESPGGDLYTLATLYRGDKNERRQCSELPQIDLSLWGGDAERRQRAKRKPQTASTRLFWWLLPNEGDPWS